jgi:histidine triad (HIT) family protein
MPAPGPAVPVEGCVFCAIVRGTAPSHVVHEDAQTLAVLDINPAADGHTLVVPKQHADDLFDIDAESAAAVMRTVKLVADRTAERLAPDGLTLFQANRAAGWQDVFHLHVHVVPRWDGDGLVRPWQPVPAPGDHLAAIAKTLRTAR